jgi:hypothetical protein
MKVGACQICGQQMFASRLFLQHAEIPAPRESFYASYWPATPCWLDGAVLGYDSDYGIQSSCRVTWFLGSLHLIAQQRLPHIVSFQSCFLCFPFLSFSLVFENGIAQLRNRFHNDSLLYHGRESLCFACVSGLHCAKSSETTRQKWFCGHKWQPTRHRCSRCRRKVSPSCSFWKSHELTRSGDMTACL